MKGSETNRGENYRTPEELFTIAELKKDTFTCKIFLNLLEIYNEKISDLLATEALFRSTTIFFNDFVTCSQLYEFVVTSYICVQIGDQIN